MQDQRRIKIRSYGLAALSGLLLALAFPPFNLFLLAFAALAPLLCAVNGSGFWKSFRRGLVCGFVFWMINMFWLAQFVTRWTSSQWLGAVPWIIACMYLSLYIGLFAGLASRAGRNKMVWLIPFVWGGVEVLRSTIPYLAFPWALLGTSLWKLPALMQPAWWVGVYGLSSFIALVNLIAAMILQGKPAKTIRPYAVAAVAVCAGSLVSYLRPQTGDTKTLAAVQPGTDLAFPPLGVQHAELAKKIPEALAHGADRARDLQLLPEGIASWDEHETWPHAPFPLNFNWNTVLGGQRTDGIHTYQSAFGVDADGRWRHADKTRLVIFGEYVPFRGQWSFIDSFNIPGGDLDAGTDVECLSLGGLVVGPVICFEVLFESVSRNQAKNGAELLAVPSNDDWYSGTGAIGNLEAAAVTRAVENRMPVIRCAPLGPSLIIDSRGDIVAESITGETITIFAEVKLGNSEVSPLREAWPYFSVFCLFAALFFARPRRSAADAH